MAKKRNNPSSKARKTKAQQKKTGLSRKGQKRILIATWLVIFSPLILLGVLMLSIPEEEIPDYALLENPVSNQASTVFAEDEKILGTFFIDNRSNVSYHELSEHLVNALVATEDERYFDHSGVDGWGLIRAIAGQVVGQNKGGGSTITQQLAKMMFHEMPSRNKWARVNEKLAEWVISARIERRYTKKEIIAMYLNQFDFVHNAVGIKSAARIYFNKKPKELSVNEAATLVGMAKNPIIYNPRINPKNALNRRNTVLNQMKKNGYINDDEYKKLKADSIQLDFKPETQNTGVAPYFRAHIKNQVQQILEDEKVLTQEGNPYNIFRDGLKIYTTVNYDMQVHAENAVEKYLGDFLQKEFEKDNATKKHSPYGSETTRQQRDDDIARAMKNSRRYKVLKQQGKTDVEIKASFKQKVKMEVFDWSSPNRMKSILMSPLDSLYHYKKILKVGLVSMNPNTGFIKAWVGGPDYRNFKYDYVANAKRQVGSTIKPFVYGAAVEHGLITSCTTFPNIEYCLDLDYGSEIRQWCPKGSGFDGLPMPVHYALAASKNPITAKIIKESGGNNKWVVDLFDKMDLANNSFQPVPALGLGVCDLSPLEVTAAHCIFSNKGVYNQPIMILRIEDRNGRVLYDAQPKKVEILSPKSAFEVLKMMKGALGVVNPYNGKEGGTARRLRWEPNYGGFSNPIAGKTGTTQNASDGWFVGHTPDLVSGIWVGNDDRIIHFKSNTLGQGARMALPIWGYYMKAVYSDKDIKISKGDFTPPAPDLPTVVECETIEPSW